VEDIFGVVDVEGMRVCVCVCVCVCRDRKMLTMAQIKA